MSLVDRVFLTWDHAATAAARMRAVELPVKLLFVCLGNICRSPTAEAVMRHLVEEAGITDEVEIESAGTGSWHIGHEPDERSAAAAAARGIEMTGKARQVSEADFYHYDLVLAMDGMNFEDLVALAPDAEAESKVHLLREFDPESTDGDLDVPDPYYGGARGFDDVLDMVDAACRGLLDQVLAPER
ncbi:MAG TPA: low molecular weight protein-tyrosine-phosphatase [Solirubrobacterales bacterium]|nr:low molecular weight protein-tyrosine-phosphatase [Solirubrobacterales bacterium]